VALTVTGAIRAHLQKSDKYCLHQQYLCDAKNPYGYCPDHGTGVSCPIGVVSADG